MRVERRSRCGGIYCSCAGGPCQKNTNNPETDGRMLKNAANTLTQWWIDLMRCQDSSEIDVVQVNSVCVFRYSVWVVGIFSQIWVF